MLFLEVTISFSNIDNTPYEIIASTISDNGEMVRIEGNSGDSVVAEYSDNQDRVSLVADNYDNVKVSILKDDEIIVSEIGDTSDNSSVVTKPVSDEYIVTFNANGGTSSDNKLTTDASGKLTSLPTAARTGYTFDGWFTGAEGGEKITADTIFTEDTTVYAHWTEVPHESTDIIIKVTIPKPAENAPSTGNIKADVKQNGGTIKTLNIDSDGKTSLDNLADGKYTFTFYADNCAPRTYNVTVTNGKLNGLEDGVELHLYGDIDGDGKVNMKDVGKANAHAKNTAKLSYYDLSVSDINGDDKINMQDVGLMNAHAKNTKGLW